MGPRFLVSVVAVAFWAVPPLASADDPVPSEYARVEVRGRLGKRTDTVIVSDLHAYKITLGKGESAQTYHLLLPKDKAVRKAAKELDGLDVVVAGELQVKLLYDYQRGGVAPLAVGELRVKRLQKADPPRK